MTNSLLNQKLLSCFSFLFLILIPFVAWAANDTQHYVLVSVAPHKFFVEKIAGDTVKVGLIVPQGASAHTYEPTPKQVVKISKAEAWFRIGEGFEDKVLKVLTAYNPNLVVADLRTNVDMISADPHSGHHCCHCNSQDLHIWLSAREAKPQAITIANTLSTMYPENKEFYQRSLIAFLQELDSLDNEISNILSKMKNRTIFVSHPAYAYFCRDYGIDQLSLEVEGKDPTPQTLNMILNQARNKHIKKIFIQAQYSNKGAKLFAKELNAELVMLDPYAENFIDSMRKIARNFAAQ